MLTQEDFYEKANKFALLKDTDDKYYTYEEYQSLIKDNQTDKDGNLIYLYATHAAEQYSYIGQLDVAMVSMLEQKFEKSRFTRVDSDVIDHLIAKEERKDASLEVGQRDILSSVFRSQLPQMKKVEFNVETQSLGETGTPIMITQSEYMRRMKEMANIQAGMSFYGEMPDMFNLVLNVDHKLVKQVLNDADNSCKAALEPIEAEMTSLNKRHDELHKAQEGKKADEIPQAEKDKLSDVEKKLADEKTKKEAVLGEYAGGNKVIRQLIDLALLQNNMLKGEALNNFVKRSIDLIIELI